MTVTRALTARRWHLSILDVIAIQVAIAAVRVAVHAVFEWMPW